MMNENDKKIIESLNGIFEIVFGKQEVEIMTYKQLFAKGCLRELKHLRSMIEEYQESNIKQVHLEMFKSNIRTRLHMLETSVAKLPLMGHQIDGETQGELNTLKWCDGVCNFSHNQDDMKAMLEMVDLFIEIQTNELEGNTYE